MGLLALGAVGAAALLTASDAELFRTYFGSLHPVVATTLVALTGLASLSFLEGRGWLRVKSPGAMRKSSGRSALIATGLVVPVLVLDLLGGFPEELNVGLPQSLLFYPLMGLIAEFVFHAAALAVLLGTAGVILPRRSDTPERHGRVLWGCILLAAAIEPVLQMVWGSGQSPSWSNAYVGVHVFAFNLLALYVFKRYDFFSAYLFRLMYYAEWHVLWGYLRLHVLF